jgi:transmembrane sensor
MTTRQTAAEVEQIAAAWLAREDAEPLDPGDQEARDAWLRAEDRHLGAYLRLRAVSARMDRLAALGGGAAAVRRRRPWFRTARRLAAGVVAAAVLLGGGLWLAAQPRSYTTDLGETRRLTLADGSMIELNTATRVRIAYSKDRRDIWLDRGEGNFRVAKDRSRPFVVHTAGGSVTAVGTAFSVRVAAAEPMRVVVSEGVVRLAARSSAPPLLVSAFHEAAVVDGRAEAASRLVSVTEIGRRLAWTDGKIVLEGQTLGEAATEFNRYNDRRLVVTPAARGLQVGGVFRTSEVEAFARATAASLRLRVSADAGRDIVLDVVPDQAEKTYDAR